MEFKIVSNTNEAVLIEVIFSDDIDKMSNKGFSGKEKYIKFTKGKIHTVTLYDENMDSYFSFYFGEGGHGQTMISDETISLREKVYHFILSQHIQPRKMTSEIETELKIMSPKSGLGIKDHYCIHLGGEFATFLRTEQEIKDLFGEYEIYDKTIAVTGVTVHKAKLHKSITKKTYIIHSYVDNLIDNPDGKFDSFDSSWFKVPADWLQVTVKKMGFSSLDDFYSSYTYDDTDGMLEKAINDGVLLGCGTGDIRID